MNVTRLAAVLAGSLVLACSTPALAANEWPVEPGNYVEVSGISVDDGHMLDYAQHLATIWRRSQDYAKKQGWITGYEILTNEYKRQGEPDLYLITRFTQFPTKAESDRRDEQYRAYMQTTDAQMQAALGERARYRHTVSSMLLREQDWRK